MNNAALAEAATRAITITQHPLAGQVLYFYIGDSHNPITVFVQVFGAGRRASLGALIAWAYLIETATVELRKLKDAIHVNVRGELSPGQIEISCVYRDRIAEALADRVEWKNDRATTTIHHLRAVQVGTYRTAVAA